MTDALIHLRASAWAGMTPAEFRDWQAHMGLTVRATAELLGAAPSTVQDWRTGVSRSTGQPIELPRILALACGALAAGVGPWAARGLQDPVGGGQPR